MSDYTQTQDNRQQQYKRYDFVLAGAIKMRKPIAISADIEDILTTDDFCNIADKIENILSDFFIKKVKKFKVYVDDGSGFSNEKIYEVEAVSELVAELEALEWKGVSDE